MDMDIYKIKAKHKQSGSWVYGVPMKIENKYMLLLEDEENLLRVHYTDEEMWLAETYAVEIDETTICRPTGLTDKNGCKIWENDIFKHYNRALMEDFESYVIGSVIWDESHCRFTNYDSIKNEYYCMDDSCVYEIIGNIFDNPELLGV